VQNIRYAKALLPDFSFDKPLVQYPPSSLKKTPNQVFAVTQEVMRKFEKIRTIRGVQMLPEDPPYIIGLKPIHVYQKGIEAHEKMQRFKVQMGFAPSEIPKMPFRQITPSEVYELVLRLDGIATLMLKRVGDKGALEYIYQTNHPVYTDKVPSDVYFNLWKISRMLDLLSGSEYTPNETWLLAKSILGKLATMNAHFGVSSEVEVPQVEGKRPKDVFEKVLELNQLVRRLQKRANMVVTVIEIPKEKRITPNTVYNALRIVNASINETMIHLGIEAEEPLFPQKVEGRTPSDVFVEVTRAIETAKRFVKDESYAK